jgi:hypothetical protein
MKYSLSFVEAERANEGCFGQICIEGVMTGGRSRLCMACAGAVERIFSSRKQAPVSGSGHLRFWQKVATQDILVLTVV